MPTKKLTAEDLERQNSQKWNKVRGNKQDEMQEYLENYADGAWGSFGGGWGYGDEVRRQQDGEVRQKRIKAGKKKGRKEIRQQIERIMSIGQQRAYEDQVENDGNGDYTVNAESAKHMARALDIAQKALAAG